MTVNEADRRSFLFKRLVLMFHTAAMQQLGKLYDPVTGSVQRDLEQAALSIDTLDMLFEKSRGNLTVDEENFLKHIISELKLNYVDEVGRPESQPVSAENKPDEQQSTQTAAT